MPITYEQETPQEKWYWRWINKAPVNIVAVFMILGWASWAGVPDLVKSWKDYAGVVLSARAISAPIEPVYEYTPVDKRLTATFPYPAILKSLENKGFTATSAWLNVQSSNYDSETKKTTEDYKESKNFAIPTLNADGVTTTISLLASSFPQEQGAEEGTKYTIRLFIILNNGADEVQCHLYDSYLHRP